MQKHPYREKTLHLCWLYSVKAVTWSDSACSWDTMMCSCPRAWCPCRAEEHTHKHTNDKCMLTSCIFFGLFYTGYTVASNYGCLTTNTYHVNTGTFQHKLQILACTIRCFLHCNVAKASSSLLTIMVCWDAVARFLRTGLSWLWRRSMWNFRWPLRLNLRLCGEKKQTHTGINSCSVPLMSNECRC